MILSKDELMSLNLINLKYFCDAVKLGSVTKAAKANFVTQSAISQGIAKLEKSLGAQLLAHHPNQFRLTPAGEQAFIQGRELLAKSLEFKQLAFANGIGSLDFASTYSFAVAVIPPYLWQFKKNYPEVSVNFALGKNSEIKQMLKSGTIDFGIGPDEGDLEGFDQREIYRGTFQLYVSSSFNKEKGRELGFILADRNCKDTQFFKNAYQKIYGTPPPVILEVNSWEVIANLTLEGFGIGYFPDYIALKKKKGLVRCDLGLPDFEYRFVAYSPKGMSLRKSSEIFISSFGQ